MGLNNIYFNRLVFHTRGGKPVECEKPVQDWSYVIDRNELAFRNGGLLRRMVFYGNATETPPHIFIIKTTKKKFC